MKPTDAEKFYLLVSALDRLAVAVEQGEQDERVDALLAAEEAKRLAEVPGGPLSATEIAHLQFARTANEIATAKYASPLPRLLAELMRLRRQVAAHVHDEEVLNERIKQLEQERSKSPH